MGKDDKPQVEKQPKVEKPKEKHVDLTEYKWGKVVDKDGVHSSLDHLVNGKAFKKKIGEDLKGDRVTIIVSAPEKWGGSLSSHPGHCGIALWNSSNFNYQSFGIVTDEAGTEGTFMSEEVNTTNDYIKKDKDFKIWYFTKIIDVPTYEKMLKRTKELAKKKVGYGEILVMRGWTEDSSYSCVTAVDTILVAGGLSKGVGAQLSSPYAYAQTFTSAFWYISYGVGYKHM